MNYKAYIGDLIGGSLMIAESRIIADVLLKKLNNDEWKNIIIEKNILQKKSTQTGIRYAKTIKHRIEPLGEEFLKELLDSDETTCVQLLMVALLIQSPIVEDFMRQVLTEVRRTYKLNLPVDAWHDFSEDCMRAIPGLDKYSESSIKKMGNNAIRALVDGGYLNSSRSRQIQAVYLLPKTKEWLKRLGREELIDVMECTI